MKTWIIILIAILVLGLGFGNKKIAVLLGFGETAIATADVVRKRLADGIQQAIGKGDIAIQQYENKIQDVKDKLIRVKVARKTYEPKLQAKQAELAEPEKKNAAAERIHAVKTLVQDMSGLLAELQAAETKLENKLKTMVDNLDIIKLKISVLEAKAEMLKIQTEVQDYAKVETDVQSNDKLIEKITADLTQQTYTLQAQQEIENLLRRVE